MTHELTGPSPEAPPQNFDGGIYEINLPEEYGIKESGKVRDTWVIDGLRFEVTTDRLSAFNKKVCTVPGRGQLLVAFTNLWSDLLADTVDTDIISSPHPNILVRRHMETTVPAEVILRDYMAESSTQTSIYRQYTEYGRRNIYGIDFPDGLRSNEKFPMGTIVTPTTKSADDEEMTDERARVLVDEKLGVGAWDATKNAAKRVFAKGASTYRDHGIMPADSKFEFGWENGKPVLIDEIWTPDSSRFWLAHSYMDRFLAGRPPVNFDKEIIRREMTRLGYILGGPIPVIEEGLKERTLDAYQEPYIMLTGEPLRIQNVDQESLTQSLIGAIHTFAPSFRDKSPHS